jgi:hypothetical protein
LGARLLAGLAAVLAAAASGCGSSHAPGTAADPALAIPASAPVYVGATVRPAGELASGARAAGQKLTGQSDPFQRLVGVLQTPGSRPLTFKRDVARWLGPRAGLFLSSGGATGRAGASALLSLLVRALQSGASSPVFPFAPTPRSGVLEGGEEKRNAVTPQGAIVLDTSDAGKARSFLQAQAKQADAKARSYRGVAYEASAGGVAFGLVNRFAVIGSEQALRAVIDTVAGAPSLARGPAYQRLLAAAPQGALAHLYVDGAALSAGVPATGAPHAGAEGAGSQDLVTLLAGGARTNVSLLPARSSIALDVDSLPAGSAREGRGPLAPDAEAVTSFGELPGESFFALGFGPGGAALAQDVGLLTGLASLASSSAPPHGAIAGLSVNSLLRGFLVPVQALTANTPQARRDFQSWMGGGGIFLGGKSLFDVTAGLVISSKNPALSRTAVAKLARSLRAQGGSVQTTSIPGTDAAVTAGVPGLPVALSIADGRDAQGHTKFVIGLGESSLLAALKPASALAGSASYSTAVAALGEGIQPHLSVQVPSALSLLGSAGLSDDPTIAPVLPYLRSLESVAAGSRKLSGGLTRFRAVVGLRGEG